jgi:hypothetical protein
MNRFGEWRYSFTILDLGNRQSWVDSFTFRPLHPLGGPQSLSGRYGEEKIPGPAGNRTPASNPQLAAIQSELTPAHFGKLFI